MQQECGVQLPCTLLMRVMLYFVEKYDVNLIGLCSVQG